MTLRLIKSDIKENPPYQGPHRQMPLRACFAPMLNNPFLNSLYKREISYTERWFLEAKKLILDEDWDHPVVAVLLDDADLRCRLVESTVIDAASMRAVLADPDYPQYHVSAGVNLTRLQRWAGFFVSL